MNNVSISIGRQVRG